MDHDRTNGKYRLKPVCGYSITAKETLNNGKEQGDRMSRAPANGESSSLIRFVQQTL
jgi:hypothetical protein